MSTFTPSSRTLIAGAVHVNTKAKAELLKMWYALLRAKNQEADFLVADCCSPLPPVDFMGWGEEAMMICMEPEEPPAPTSPSKHVIIRFADDIKHPFYEGGGTLDGGSQAIALMASYALAQGYDHLVTIEGDVLFARDVGPICQKLRRHKVGIATCMEPTYQWIENQIMFLDVAWLREGKFLERFAWRTPVDRLDRKTYGEVRMERVFGEELFLLPIRGFRNEKGQVNWGNIDKVVQEQGLDYLCHCADFGIYEKFMRLKGVPKW